MQEVSMSPFQKGLLILAGIFFFSTGSAILKADSCCGMNMTKSEKKECVMAKSNKADAKKAASEQKYGSPEAKIGDTVICPVMKTHFTVTSKSLFTEVKGKKYYLCCGMCPDKLKSDPDTYLK